MFKQLFLAFLFLVITTNTPFAQCTKFLTTTVCNNSRIVATGGSHKTEKYKVLNVLGSKILSGNISNQEKINIESLSKGLYFLPFENGSAIKFIKGINKTFSNTVAPI